MTTRDTHDVLAVKRLDLYDRHLEIAKWHGALQAKFEIETFGHTLYVPLNGLTVADDQG